MKKRTLILLFALTLLLASCSGSSSNGGDGGCGEVCHAGQVVIADRAASKR